MFPIPISTYHGKLCLKPPLRIAFVHVYGVGNSFTLFFNIPILVTSFSDSITVHSFVHLLCLLCGILMSNRAVTYSFSHVFHRRPAVAHFCQVRLQDRRAVERVVNCCHNLVRQNFFILKKSRVARNDIFKFIVKPL